jgi:FkbM family methyltransferase
MSIHTPFWAKPGFDKEKPMLIYGYGLFGLNWLRAFVAEGFSVKAIFDRDPKYNGQTIKGIPILLPEHIKDFSRECNVFISTRYWSCEITKMFRELGFENIYWNYTPEMEQIDEFLSLRDKYSAIANSNREKIDRARAFFSEDKSLEVFDAAIDAYSNGNFERLGATASPFQNLIAERDIFRFSSDEVFADVGAFTGDTAFAFAQAMEYKYKRIYSFEPAELEFKLLERAFEYYKLERAEAHRFAVCNTDGFVAFSDDNSQFGARISDDVKELAPSTTLDNFFLNQNKEPLPTYIHMDIEGAEVDALEGSRYLIAECKPKMSISSYHRLEHYWEVLLKIEEIVPGEYEFFMRHYGNWYDSMCLARPKL